MWEAGTLPGHRGDAEGGGMLCSEARVMLDDTHSSDWCRLLLWGQGTSTVRGLRAALIYKVMMIPVIKKFLRSS